MVIDVWEGGSKKFEHALFFVHFGKVFRWVQQLNRAEQLFVKPLAIVTAAFYW